MDLPVVRCVIGAKKYASGVMVVFMGILIAYIAS